MAEIPLWIERLGEKELTDFHLKVLNRVIEVDWKNEDQNELLDQLLAEIRVRMSAV